MADPGRRTRFTKGSQKNSACNFFILHFTKRKMQELTHALFKSNVDIIVCLPSPYMGYSETIYLIVQHSLSIVRRTDYIVEPVIFCFMVYCAA